MAAPLYKYDIGGTLVYKENVRNTTQVSLKLKEEIPLTHASLLV